MGSLDDYADEAWFVITAYVFAFGPWIYYSAVDHVDSRWRPVSRLQGQTELALLVCTVGVTALAFYVAVQFLAGDWKEAMAALVVVGGTVFPIQRALRQLWILKANAALERMIGSTFGTWQPRNTNVFFDNDYPGEGVTDVRLWRWLRDACGIFKSDSRCCQPLPLPVSPALENGRLLESLEDHWGEFHKKIDGPRTVWMRKLEYDMRMISGGPDENGILRSLWLYENLVDEHQTLTNIIRLGLAVAVVESDTAPPAFLPWLEGCCAEEAGGSADGLLADAKLSIPRVGILPDLSTHARQRTLYDDCSEAFLKLPPARISERRNGKLLWEDFMVLINSTLELAFFTQWCLGPEVARGCSEACLTIEVVLAHKACWLMHTDSSGAALSRHKTIKHTLAMFSTELQPSGGPDLVGAIGEEGEEATTNNAATTDEYSSWTAILARINPVAKNLTGCMRRPPFGHSNEENQFRQPGESGLNALRENAAALRSAISRS